MTCHTYLVILAGPKAQRRFQRLMMVRIKWDEEKKGKRNGKTYNKYLPHI